MDARAKPALAFAACCALWGTTFLVIRVGNETMPPLWAAGLRLAIAAAILGVLALAFRQAVPRGRALAVVLVYGALEFGANLGLLYWAERTVPSGLAAVFYATAPLTAMLLARALGTEKLDLWKLLATIVAFAGLAIAFASELSARADPLALLAVLGAATSAAAAGVFLQRVPPQPVLMTNAIGCAIGAILLIPAAALFREDLSLPASRAAWWPVIYLVLAGSVGAYVLFTYVLTKWSASTATLVGVIVPIIALILGALLAGERLAWTTLGGGVLVLVGVGAAITRGLQMDRQESARGLTPRSAP